MNKELKFQNLCNLTTSVLGLPEGSLAEKSRRQELQVPRAVISIIARLEEDIHQTVIAKGLKRDRSLIYHYEKMHKSNYATFPKYRKTFIDVYIAYCNTKKQNKVFKTQKQFEDCLIENKIKSSETYQTIVHLRSGNFYIDLKLNFKEFYNVIEIIKFALKDYHYEYKVI